MGRHGSRPPTVDRVRPHEGRERHDDEHGVWATFVVIVLLYIAVGVTTVVVLRRMSRRSTARPTRSASPTTAASPTGRVTRSSLGSTSDPDKAATT